jgi:hypothetical protein
LPLSAVRKLLGQIFTIAIEMKRNLPGGFAGRKLDASADRTRAVSEQLSPLDRSNLAGVPD